MNRHKPYIVAVALVLFFATLFFIYYSQRLPLFSFQKKTSLLAGAQVETIFAEEKKNVLQNQSDHTPVTILFVGDIMLSRAIGRIMVKKQDWTYPFLLTGDFLKGADITFGNLEGPISSRGVNIGSIYSFRADPKTAEGLAYAGFDVMSIANNHMWDYGRESFMDTMSILSSYQIDYVGGGENYAKAHTPLVRDVRGTKVAFLAYTNLLPKFLGTVDAKPSVAFPDDMDQMILDIRNAKAMADVVIVSFHFGDEYSTKHNAYQKKLAYTAIDSGASVIIGHHPHVVQEVEAYNGGYIAYSLGNFVFDQNFSADTGKGLVGKVTLIDKKIVNFETYEVGFNETYQPAIKKQ